MTLRVVSGTANRPLAEAVAEGLRLDPTGCAVERFPDGELRPTVECVRGADVYVVQPTAPPVNEHVVELLLLLDACRRSGAARLTAVVPYFGYARQDRRSRAGQAVGARVIADALAAAGTDRLVVVDPHTAALEAMCPIRVEMVTAVPVLANALGSAPADPRVVVAPDLGAVKLAEHYASLLRGSVAVVRKHRVSGTVVRAEELVGDVEARHAVIVDDMISSGGTIEAAVRILLDHRAAPDIVVTATHGPLTEAATGCLRALDVDRILVTDSVAHRDTAAPLRVCSLAPLLTEVIARLHNDEQLDNLLLHT
ncbi:ribose-phosphate pyrophosphokinase (plasmid) [Rhodococcus opacus]|uniref:ribose-phosphate diphosphokinase n=1 Tax=Rhodococcus opacus TaxID=37919 RepID=A0A1B1KHC0_RHOOP|nr:ribose-phosphate pyrophosphokinase [Rhodococcus opacus]ANS32012.1 ribose-phosphate pyrophosphokinase [Rhodococcus opacus]